MTGMVADRAQLALPAGTPPALARRWEALVARHPSLGPWLAREVVAIGRRLRDEDDAPALLFAELARALAQFEQLSPLDLRVVASTVSCDPADEPRPRERLGLSADAAERLDRRADERAASPQDAALLRASLLQHPGMKQAAAALDGALYPALERARAAHPRVAAVPAQIYLEQLRNECLRDGVELSTRVALGVLLNLALAGEDPLLDRDVALFLKLAPGRARSPRELTALRAAASRLPAAWGVHRSPDDELLLDADAIARVAASAHQTLEEAVALLGPFFKLTPLA